MSDYNYDLALIDGQLDELRKIAFVGGVARALRKGTAPRGALIGAGAGALGGGALGAASSDPQQGTAGKIQGAISGALSGGLLGAGAGTVATKAGRRWIGQAGKAQAHGLTGWVPGARKAGFGWAGKGMTGAQRRKALGEIGIHAPAGRLSHGQALGKIQKGRLTGKLPLGMQQQLADLSVARHGAQKAQVEQGLTSVPGFVKGMVKDPTGTARTGLLAAGGLGTAMTVGFSAPEMAEAAKERDLKHLGGAAAETAFYGIGGGIPMLGSMALGGGARRLGQVPGTIAQKITGQDQAQSQGAAGVQRAMGRASAQRAAYHATREG